MRVQNARGRAFYSLVSGKMSEYIIFENNQDSYASRDCYQNVFKVIFALFNAENSNFRYRNQYIMNFIVRNHLKSQNPLMWTSPDNIVIKKCDNLVLIRHKELKTTILSTTNTFLRVFHDMG